MATLCLSSKEGGLDLPDIWRYQLSAHLCFIPDWVHKQPTSLWLDIESSISKFPLKNLLFLKTLKFLKSACSNPITVNTVKAWRTIRRIEGRSQITSILSPICDNLNFLPGTTDSGFRIWATKGISNLCDLFDGSTLMSFTQLTKKYKIQKQDFFWYLQIRDYVKRDTTLLLNQSYSCIEKLVFCSEAPKSISVFHNVLRDYGNISTLHLKQTWEKELDVKITNDQWYDAWKSVRDLRVCNRVKATQLKILHRAHISPSKRHRFDAEFSPICLKCKTEIASLTHCLWSCWKIQRFWFNVGQEINKILSVNFEINAIYMLLGLSNITDNITSLLINIK